MAVTSAARGDSRACRWRPPEVTRARQSELGSCRGRTCWRVYGVICVDWKIACINRIVWMPNQCECLMYGKTPCGELEM